MKTIIIHEDHSTIYSKRHHEVAMSALEMETLNLFIHLQYCSFIQVYLQVPLIY